ncbi:MAG: gliding motility protein GldL [Muribaculaceae bacterium]|nr:gliding motility protein GldL [Muribaculaceae bacterium]
MTNLKRYKNRIEIFLSGDSGQRFFNFAYSIGAAIVILGALFKILHLPGGNLLLSIGMGTEVLMFILTAFDRPPRAYAWEEVFPVLESHDPADRPAPGASGGVSGVVIAGNGESDVNGGSYGDGAAVSQPGTAVTSPAGGTVVVGAVGATAPRLPEFDSSAISEAGQGYVDQLRAVVDEMAEMRRSTQALNTLYEMQLKNLSSQLGVTEGTGRDLERMRRLIEQSAEQSRVYCEQTALMAENMRQLNDIYARMIAAMSRQAPANS